MARAERAPTFHMVTFGCQMNRHDSERIAGALAAQGMTPAAGPQDADVLIYNTCCVRRHAEERFYGQLTQLAPLKHERPEMIIAVTGCVAQKDGDEVFARAPHVDLVVGTHAVGDMPHLVQAKLDGLAGRVCTTGKSEIQCTELPALRRSAVYAWMSIMTGCDNFCSYCIVPHVRGSERSRPIQELLVEAEALAADGVLDVTLLGQNVNSYGRDSSGAPHFADLLRRLNDCGIPRIRFTTSHPKDLSDETIEAIASSPRVCRHIHLPVQSGSTAILARMNRGYTKESYLRLVERIRERMPDVSISTDIMVGFPGETERDFEDTIDVVKTAKLDQAFTFIFSKRSGTPAAEMDDQVAEDVKHERFEKLVAEVAQGARTANEAYVGRHLEVLVEGPSAKDPNRLTGRTATNKLVHFPHSPELRHRLVGVTITGARTWFLEGRLSSSRGHGDTDGRSGRRHRAAPADNS